MLKATVGIHNSFLFHCRFEDMTVADLRQMFTSKYIWGGGGKEVCPPSVLHLVYGCFKVV